MDFLTIAEIFEDMQRTRSRLLLIDHLVGLFKSTPDNTIKKTIYLLQGKLSPTYEGVELGLGEKLTIKAIAESSGISVKEVEDKYGLIGDLGETAKEIAKIAIKIFPSTPKMEEKKLVIKDTFSKDLILEFINVSKSGISVPPRL